MGTAWSGITTIRSGLQKALSPAQLSQLLHGHITTVMKHYAGHVFAWDVVNEGLDEKGTPRDSPWYNRPAIGLSGQGTAYIEQAFRWAHEADSKALLFYSEAEGDTLNRKSDAIYAMVRDFKNRAFRSMASDCTCTFLASTMIPAPAPQTLSD